jgi:hypothetical protein
VQTLFAEIRSAAAVAIAAAVVDIVERCYTARDVLEVLLAELSDLSALRLLGLSLFLLFLCHFRLLSLFPAIQGREGIPRLGVK